MIRFIDSINIQKKFHTNRKGNFPVHNYGLILNPFIETVFMNEHSYFIGKLQEMAFDGYDS